MGRGQTWKCRTCDFEHPWIHKECWNKQCIAARAKDGDTKARSKGKSQGAWSKGPPSTSKAGNDGPKDGSRQSQGKDQNTPPSSQEASVVQSAESAEMLAAREQLECVQAKIAGLAGFKSAAAVADVSALRELEKDWQHRINALKAPKDRLPGLRKAVKNREAALQEAKQKLVEASAELTKAEKVLLDAQVNVVEADTALSEIKAKALEAEREAELVSSTNALANSPASKASHAMWIMNKVEEVGVSEQERAIFNAIMIKVANSLNTTTEAATAPAAVATAGAQKPSPSSAASQPGLPASTPGVNTVLPPDEASPKMPTKGDMENRKLVQEQAAAAAAGGAAFTIHSGSNSPVSTPPTKTRVCASADLTSTPMDTSSQEQVGTETPGLSPRMQEINAAKVHARKLAEEMQAGSQSDDDLLISELVGSPSTSQDPYQIWHGMTESAGDGVNQARVEEPKVHPQPATVNPQSPVAAPPPVVAAAPEASPSGRSPVVLDSMGKPVMVNSTGTRLLNCHAMGTFTRLQ